MGRIYNFTFLVLFLQVVLVMIPSCSGSGDPLALHFAAVDAHVTVSKLCIVQTNNML